MDSNNDWRQRLYIMVFQSDTVAGRRFDGILLLIILASLVIVMLDSIDTIHQNYADVLAYIEWGFTLIFAIEYGADRVHGTALGIGERVGNAALDQILLNLKLLGELPEHDLSKLLLWCKTASLATRVPIHPQNPLAGGDAFRTATGVHAAAIIKAEKKGHSWLADRIYSGVPAGMFGKEQEIEIGHYSGESNVVYWLRKRG